MLATIFEAIIGAAYCDGGMPAARTVMTSLGLFGDEKDIMATSSLRGSAADLMILSTANNLNIWIPYRASG
jgi:dsRNA-specific ribonuclease